MDAQEEQGGAACPRCGAELIEGEAHPCPVEHEDEHEDDDD